MTWFAEHRLTWVLPSGERKPGRIAIGLPEVVETPDANEYQCRYLIEPFSPPRGFGRASDTLGALSHVLTILGTELYVMLAHKGVRVTYEDQSGDPDEDSLYLLMMLGPLIRDAGNPRGVADPEGRLAKIFGSLRLGER